MNHVIGKTRMRGGTTLVGVLAALGCVVAALPAIAAPGDTSISTRRTETSAIDRPTGSTYEYLSIAGSTFHPVDNSTTYSYPGNGCIAKTGGSDSRFVHKVILPKDAIVRYARLYYYNMSTRNVLGYFTTYDGAGNYQELNSVTSASGPTGYASVLSTEFDYSVDPYTAAINFLINLDNQNDDTLRFCGVRIAYDAPTTDRIFANGFEDQPL